MKEFLLSVLFPPGIVVAMLMLGLAAFSWRPRLAKKVLAAASLLLLALSLPLVSDFFLDRLQTLDGPPPPIEAGRADAIVILSAGRMEAPEYGGETVDALSLERLRYGADISRRTGLPILVTGGRLTAHEPLARLMSRVLERDFGVPVRWQETEAQDTAANAALSARILLPEGIRRIYLVTHAWHMPRALAAFEAAGFEALPAPTGWVSPPRLGPTDFMPSAHALQNAYYAAHEWVGLFLYRWRLRRPQAPSRHPF